MNEIKTVTDDDKGQLIGEFSLFEEVLDLLRVIMVALATDPFDFTNLASASSSLYVLEVDLGVFA
jgi:hypothetical protein